MKKKSTLALCIASLVLILVICIAGTFSLADKDFTYVSDMTEKSVATGWGALCKDKGFDGKKISISDGKGNFVTYDKGVFVHASSEIEYDISNKLYGTFEAYIGVNNSSDNAFPQSSSVTFEVLADGKSMYKSGTFKIGTAAEHIIVEIPTGTKILTLKTTDAGDGNTGDHSVWADAKLVIGNADPTSLMSVTVSADKTEAAIGSTIKLTTTAKRVNGETYTPAGVVYKSENTQIATVSNGGSVKLVGIGSTGITATYTEGDRTISDTLTVSSYDEKLMNTWNVESPDKTITAVISQGKFGEITYSVKKGNTVVVEEGSDIGIKAQECLFTDGFTFVSQSTKVIDEHYVNYSGKCDEGYDHANELTVRFEKSEYYYDVIFRAYDDGFAFRYTISNKNGTQDDKGLTFTGETSSFVLPSKSDIYAIKVSNLTDSFNHEAGYGKYSSDNVSGYLAFPILYNTGDTWVLLTEAELYGDPYVGSMTKASKRELTLQWAPKVIADSVQTCIPFTSPWRMGIVGGLDTIVESNLVEDVSERRDEDSSWVQPGVTAWMWLTEGYAGQHDYKIIKRYIDLASELGWKYLILDEGWQPVVNKNGKKYDGYYAWFDEMIQYADDKGVGIIVWVLCADLDTPAEREVLKEWADKGIKGIKVDFFDSEDAPHISYYKAIYEECYKNKLIANVHGANKPTGERQYYPNIINREAVNGEEYGGFGTNDAVVWTFTRGVVGPMDVTPRYNPSVNWSTTIGSQLAVNVLFESGMQCMASKPDEYLTGDEYLFYKDLPSSWNETKFVSGFPGQYTVMARRSGDSWYVGGMTVSARSVDITFDFLDSDGEYTALIFADGKSRYDTDNKVVSVKKGDKISVSMLSNGGFVMRIIKKSADTNITAIKSDKTDIVIKGGETTVLGYTLEPAGLKFADLLWESSDENVVIVTRGEITGVRVGKATITARSYFDDSVKLVYNIEVTTGGSSLRGDWTLINPLASSDYGFYVNDSGNLILRSVAGNMSGSIKNIIATNAPKGDFEVLLKIKANFKKYHSQAGIMIFNKGSLTNAASVAFAFTDPDGDKYPSSMYAIAGSSSNGRFTYEPQSTVAYMGLWLKIEVKNGVASFAYSTGGTKDWTTFGKNVSVKNILTLDDPMIGIYSCSAGGSTVENVTILDLRINGESVSAFVKNNDGDRTIVSSDMEKDLKVSVDNGTEIANIGLPEKVKITLSDDSVEEVEIVWSCNDYNPLKSGEYTFTGKIKNIPDEVSEGAFSLSAKVEVKARAVPGETPEPTATSTPTDQSDKKGDSTVVIVVVVVLVCLVVAGAVVFVLKKKSKK